MPKTNHSLNAKNHQSRKPMHNERCSAHRTAIQTLVCATLLLFLQNSARADTALRFNSFSIRNDQQTTFGWSFSLASPILVADLGYFVLFGGGLSESHQVAIWSSA